MKRRLILLLEGNGPELARIHGYQIEREHTAKISNPLKNTLK